MENITKTLSSVWNDRPMVLIMWLAIITRLVAAIFARGWGMLDDHFLVIEVAQSWADGGDEDLWLPWSKGNEGPSGHSLFYTGIHYLLFSFFNWLHFTDPHTKMLVVRFFHATFSLITVYYGYKIAEKISNKETAKIAGLLLAVFWFMPWFSVRNLVEIVPIPLLIISTWIILKKSDNRLDWKSFLFAGLIAGIAFSIRYQTMIFAGGMGLALLFQKKYRQGIIFGVGYFIMVAIIQGGIDYYIWGRPFAELTEYFLYNTENAENYITGEWYNYLVLLLGVFIPPVSVFILVGTFRNWKKHLIIFLPTLLFFLFHSFFPNKQERFIFTIVPFIIIIGIVGWQQILDSDGFISRQKRFIRFSWIFFWVINTIALIGVSTMYSKKARAEAMTYLSRYDNVTSILLENTNSGSSDIVPKFYLGQWVNVYDINQNFPLDSLPQKAFTSEMEPRFFLFYRDQNLEQRVDDMKEYFPEMVLETASEPGFVDMIMHWLNPNNRNETIYIYRNGKYFPEQAYN
jgi:hypothetical protein